MPKYLKAILNNHKQKETKNQKYLKKHKTNQTKTKQSKTLNLKRKPKILLLLICLINP